MEKYIDKASDPVKILPKKVMDQVLFYLRAEDILRCSLVNKDWNKAIGKSVKAMEKIRICVCEPFHGMYREFSAFDAECIVKGSRKYRHISLFITRNMTTDHLILIASFKWKSLLLCHHTFKSEIELINFIGIIEPHVEELNLRTIKIVSSKQNRIASTNFSFPKLKVLKVAHCNTFVYSEIFKNIAQLHRLEIETGPPPAFAYDDKHEIFLRVIALQSMLIRNSMIRYLVLFLHQKDFDCMFIDSLLSSRIRFQLQSIKLKKFRKLVDERSNENQLRNFGYFLETQEKSLTSIHLLEWLGNGILEQIINDMNLLKFFLLEDLDCYGKFYDTLANMDLYLNESLETLSIIDKFSKVNELQKLILAYFPNLKHLHIGTVSQDILKILVERTPKIESLAVDFFIPYIIPDCQVLTSLKKITIGANYATHFKDMLRDYDSYTNFEKVFLEAAKSFDRNQRT